MAGKNKNSADNFIRYNNKTMTGSERNAFERELQKDPFAEEAQEGLSELSARQISSDLAMLKKKLHKRTDNNKRFIYLRVAASVAVLLVISAVLLLNKEKTGKTSNQIALNTTILEIPESRVIKEVQTEKKTDGYRFEKKSGETRPPVILQSKKDEKNIINNKEEYIITEDRNNVEQVAAAETINIMVPEEPLPVLELAVNELPAQEISKRSKSLKSSSIKGKVISSEDNMPLPGVIITEKGTARGSITDTDGNFYITVDDTSKAVLVADFIGMERKEFRATESTREIKLDPSSVSLDEVVVIGYGVSHKTESEEPVAYNPPEPVNGWDSFKSYIKNNIKNPTSHSPGQKVVVVLSFTVNTNTTIDSIGIVRSPGKEYSDEAVRLIKEGPSWKPAIKDGNNIPDNVRVRIVFK